MDRDILLNKSLTDLRELAKMQGVKSITRYRKAELVQIIMAGGDVSVLDTDTPLEKAPRFTPATILSSVTPMQRVVPLSGVMPTSAPGEPKTASNQPVKPTSTVDNIPMRRMPVTQPSMHQEPNPSDIQTIPTQSASEIDTSAGRYNVPDRQQPYRPRTQQVQPPYQQPSYQQTQYQQPRRGFEPQNQQQPRQGDSWNYNDRNRGQFQQRGGYQQQQGGYQNRDYQAGGYQQQSNSNYQPGNNYQPRGRQNNQYDQRQQRNDRYQQNDRYSQPRGDFQPRDPQPRTDYQPQGTYQPKTNDYHGSYQPRPVERDEFMPYSEFAQPRVEPEINVDAASKLPAVDNQGGVSADVTSILDSGECVDITGVLEIMSDGYGFIRTQNYMSSNKDIYISQAQIRRFQLKTGDFIAGRCRPTKDNERFSGLLCVDAVNGLDPDLMLKRIPFDELVPIFPEERLTLEVQGYDAKRNRTPRMIDLIAPIGKGQRGMIVSQPKSGKTTLIKEIAHGISENHPDVHLIVLLVDERPEEVTDMQRSIKGEVLYSTFDELPEHHTKLSEMVIERAMRLVECGKDVVILLDSITRLSRAYNLTIPQSGKTLSGGMDPGALFKPKRFFGAARNIEGGGSLTIIATALIDTGSRMDDMVYEEFKGTGNMEIQLDRKIAEKRVYPAIDIPKSSTRREDKLLSHEEQDFIYLIRRNGSNGAELTEQMLALIDKTDSNADLVNNYSAKLKAHFEKDGYVSGK